MIAVSVEDAVGMIPDGARLMIGGFMGVGTSERLIDELLRQGKRDLVVIANDTAMPGRGIGKLVTAGLVASTIASHIGLNPETQQQMIARKMAVELVPQGTLIERIRAGGHGLGGILTPTGLGTVVEEGKQRSRLVARATCSRSLCAPTSRWFTHSWQTTAATCLMRSPRGTSIQLSPWPLKPSSQPQTTSFRSG